MQLTRQTEYAIRALIELASAPGGTFLPSASIAAKHGLPEKFFHKTVQVLVHAGLVESRRGMHGGISLVVSPESITIADVIEAIEGKIAINPCLAEGYSCKRRPMCMVNKVFQRAQDAMVAELKKETMADLAGKGSVSRVVD